MTAKLPYVECINREECKMIYRNTNWTRRNYDCTNIVYQVTNEAPRNYNGELADNWERADKIPDDMMKIGGFAGHEFYGYM